MADNPKATLGAVSTGWLSLNEIFPAAVSSKTGLEAASKARWRTTAKRILARTSAFGVTGTLPWKPAEKLFQKRSQAITLKAAGGGRARLAQLFGSLQTIPSVICQVNHSCVNPTTTGQVKH